MKKTYVITGYHWSKDGICFVTKAIGPDEALHNLELSMPGSTVFWKDRDGAMKPYLQNGRAEIGHALFIGLVENGFAPGAVHW